MKNNERLFLFVRIRCWVCALPAEQVIETMRTLPRESLAPVPSFVAGTSVIHGSPLSVVSLSALLGYPESGGGCLVVMLVGAHRIGLKVEKVLCIAPLDGGILVAAPPLLGRAPPEQVAQLHLLDREALAVLESAPLLSDDVWQRLPTLP